MSPVTQVPRTLFHGTPKDFDAFDMEFSCDGGFHFGTYEAALTRLSAFAPPYYIIEAKLHITNPRVLKRDPINECVWLKVIHRTKRSHSLFDGIRYPNKIEGGESWVVFDVTQIEIVRKNQIVILDELAILP